MDSISDDYEKDIVRYAAMLHDVCDHKYPNSISKDDLYGFITSNLGKTKSDRIQSIIDNVSYSKEARGQRETLPEPDQTYLTALSDGDRIEALGYGGVLRCKEFSRAKYGCTCAKSVEDCSCVDSYVMEHMHEKLLKLYDHFIVTKKGKELALPLHQELVDYVHLKTAK
ncbi:hypothetical protein BC833DRAFT_593704 [Globomyces pollinis-pini]|nr:hypothetical protein BC833DRAFT_593704 [Globomyces pollinis-pini]